MAVTNLIVNPTLYVMSGSTASTLVWFTHRDGAVQWNAPQPLIERLVSFDPSVAHDLDDELIDREVLIVDPGPPPQLARTLPYGRSVPVGATIARGARVVGRLGRMHLERIGPGGIVLSDHELGADAPAVARRVAGGPPDSEIDGALAAVGVLQPDPDGFDRATAEGLDALRRSWSRDGYVVTSGLVLAAELEALQAYTRARLNYGYLDGDLDVKGRRRYSVYDDPQLAPLHQRLAPIVGAIVGHAIQRSYSFTAFYRSGGAVPAHRDLPHCRWTVSLAVDVPRSVADGWPLVLDDGSDRREVRWGDGAAAIFDGHRHAHWRPPLVDGEHATYFITHFTPDPRNGDAR